MVNVFNGIGWMFGIGGATLFAIALGKKQFADANRLFNMTFMFTISAAIAFAAMTSLFSEPILRFLGANEGTYSLAKSYYDILMFFSPLFMVNFVFISFLRNDNNPRLAMIAMLTGGLREYRIRLYLYIPFTNGVKRSGNCDGILTNNVDSSSNFTLAQD